MVDPLLGRSLQRKKDIAMNKTILIVGTFDTKNDELRFIQDVIHDQGGHTLAMGVRVLNKPR